MDYACAHKTKRFVYISSGEVYGNVSSMTSRACYPLGKQAGENLCASYNEKYGLDTVSARLCHTFGSGISGKDNRATAQFFRNAAAGEDIVLKSKGEQRRSYLYVEDCASAILSVLTKGSRGNAYDICADERIVTIAGLAEMIAEAAGVKVRFDLPDEQEKRDQSPIKQQVMDGAALKELGWTAKYSLKKDARQHCTVSFWNEAFKWGQNTKLLLTVNH